MGHGVGRFGWGSEDVIEYLYLNLRMSLRIFGCYRASWGGGVGGLGGGAGGVGGRGGGGPMKTNTLRNNAIVSWFSDA